MKRKLKEKKGTAVNRGITQKKPQKFMAETELQ
jgi:hypothetical protein